jgi:DUF4097 and DUF4098 domain-containing protein YvlB
VLGMSWSLGMLSFAETPAPTAADGREAGAIVTDPILQARVAPETGAWDAKSQKFDSRKTRWEDTLTFELDAQDVSIFDVVTPHGDVVIVGEDGADAIRVSARRVVRSSDESKGATYREGFRPVARLDGNVLAVGVLRPEGEKERRPKHVKEAVVDFTIAVPRRLAESLDDVRGPAIHVRSGHGDIVGKNVRPDMTSLRTGHGDVAITEAAGDVDIHSGHGDLAITDSTVGHLNAHTGHGDVVSSAVRGAATVKSGHGDIRLERVEGSVDAHTGHGDLSVEARGGAVTLNTGHGDVSILGHALDGLFAKTGNGDLDAELHGDTGAIELRTGNGDISLEADAAAQVFAHTGRGDVSGEIAGNVSGEVKLDTGHGDIAVHVDSVGSLDGGTGVGEIALSVAADVAFTLDASTGGGEVSSRLDLTDVERSKDGRRLRASRLGGGALIRLRSGNGDIDVRSR